MSKWSWHKLVEEYGEDAAFEHLQDCEGYGEFDPKLSHYRESVETPVDYVHTESPLKFTQTKPSMLKEGEVWIHVRFGWISEWKRNPKKENTSST